ncbi:MAG: PQQ-binding-like beta-propeller repeat protein, partial [Byssovorax sp.]
YSGDVVGLDAATGTVRFRNTVGPCFYPSWAAPAAASDVVYVPRFDGSLYAVRAGDGGVL